MKSADKNMSTKKAPTEMAPIKKAPNKNVKASMCLMGLGLLMYGQIGKGLLYLAVLMMVFYTS